MVVAGDGDGRRC